MINMQLPETRSTYSDPGADSRALNRYEDDGGPGPEDTRDQRRDVPTFAPTGDHDLVDPGRVVVTQGSTANTFQIHHRDIPELHADGTTPGEAAANLAEDLIREIEGVADHYRRGLFERVLDDVRAFTK